MPCFLSLCFAFGGQKYIEIDPGAGICKSQASAKSTYLVDTFLVCLHISWWSFLCSLDVSELPTINDVYELQDGKGVSNAVLDISLLLPASSSLSHVAVATLSTFRHGAVAAYPCLHAS